MPTWKEREACTCKEKPTFTASCERKHNMAESSQTDDSAVDSLTREYEINVLLSQYESLRDEMTGLKTLEFRVLPTTIGGIIILIAYAMFQEGAKSLLVLLPIIVGTISIYVIVIEMWVARISDHIRLVQEDLPMEMELSWEHRVSTELTGWAGFEWSSILTGGLLLGFYLGSLPIGLQVADNSNSKIINQLPVDLIYIGFTVLFIFAGLSHILVKINQSS